MWPSAFDVLKAILALVVLVAITLGWVHRSRQTRVSRAFGNSVAIVARLVYVFTSAYFLLCVLLGLPVNWFLVIVWIMLVLVPAASLDDDSMFNHMPSVNSPLLMALEFALIATVLLPVYIAKQYILGFPERGNFVLSPPKPSSIATNSPGKDVPNLDQESAIVVATLKPVGKIECRGSRYEATSFDGTLIDVGQVVRICGSQNRLFVVRPIQE